MTLFKWRDDIMDVAWFTDVCLERLYTSAGPPVGDQASEQPQAGSSFFFWNCCHQPGRRPPLYCRASRTWHALLCLLDPADTCTVGHGEVHHSNLSN